MFLRIIFSLSYFYSSEKQTEEADKPSNVFKQSEMRDLEKEVELLHAEVKVQIMSLFFFLSNPILGYCCKGKYKEEVLWLSISNGRFCMTFVRT